MERKFDEETQKYFDSLPKYIQEAINLSNVEISNKRDLKVLAQNISKASSNKGTWDKTS